MWFYYINNEKFGPITEDGLKNKFKNKEIDFCTLIWKDGMTNWLPAHRVSSFKTLLDLPKDFEQNKQGPNNQALVALSLIVICIIFLLLFVFDIL
ncbi:protein of unknown function [Clostridium grantii DSM 8605]|uniref:GYF domain-containing protein n=2 Tax=Clostridium TaxID=1485 RepID=A0A1M5VVY8_9CLOT|nr:protein of unknown function [Clostridium grantii DSM 8605]